MKLRLVDQRQNDTTWQCEDEQLVMLQRLCAGLGGEDWVLDLVLVDDSRMSSLNSDYREVPGVTDVLSFSYLDESGDGAPSVAAGSRGARHDLWRERFTLEAEAEFVAGEIVLAPAFIVQRCLENDWSQSNELALLTVHGALHILGWEHGDEAQHRLMREEETRVLATCGVEHPLRERG